MGRGRATLTALRPVALPTAYAFGWVENQAAAALKAVPLGQLAGQRILVSLRGTIAAAVRRALDTPPEAINTFAPLLGILSARHETQYSRLFHS